jgi:hypothetical protein
VDAVEADPPRRRGTSSTGELLDPAGASINEIWGMSRCGRPWNGLGLYHCAATIFQPTRQLFVNSIGAVAVQESYTGPGRPSGPT